MFLEVVVPAMFGAFIAGTGTYVAMRSAARKKLHRAYHDTLTGLPNRLLFLHDLELLLGQAKRQELTLCVLMGDLDGFKQVNDSFGHDQGDELLRQAAQRFRDCFHRATDLVCRLGGDEFIAAFVVKKPRDAEVMGRKVCAALSTPYLLPNVGDISTVGMSVGIALFPGNGESVAVLLKNADKALYVAKDNGKGRVCFFEGSGISSEVVAVAT